MNNYNYSKEDIIHTLQRVDLVKGDSIFVHSNLGFFGTMKGAKTKDDYCKIFRDSIFEVIEMDGTLIVPTFTYSFFNKEDFDLEKTPSACGMFSEWIRNESNAFRSEDPNFSVAAIGKHSKFFTIDAPSHSFGKNSFWERFFNLNGKFCNFNFDTASTFSHYVEKSLNVPYRFDKEFPGAIIKNKQYEQKSFYHFVRELKKEYEPEFTKFDSAARKQGLAKFYNLGKGQIVCISAKDSFNLISTELKKDPYFLVQGK